jgi:alkanesulfonate monooxygenase SsuD/methylene tetrahydromethanopterin reductase-like flavin-dependent oxidoreductase (luciferase family)
MIGFGRDPKDCKVMYCCGITLGDTMQDAREKKARQTAAAAANIAPRLAYMSFLSGKDFAKFDLDAPLPPIETNASRSALEAYTLASSGPTLRDIAADPSSGGLDFVGTADSIAAEMEETMAAIGGDGYLFTEIITRKAIVDITDGLAPALKRRGLVQGSYPHRLFRDNLLAF